MEIGGTLTEIEEALLQTKQGDLANIKPKLTNQWAWLYGMMADSDHRPTDFANERFDDLSQELDEHLRNLQEVLDANVSTFNEMVTSKGGQPVIAPKN